MPRWVLGSVLALTLAGTAPAADAPLDWRAAAAASHAAGDRAESRRCLRRLAQARRPADPDHARQAAETAPADALNLYAEAVETLSRRYVDPAAATPARLFAHGVAELAAALDDPAFRGAVLADPPADAVARFRADLAAWADRAPATAADARQLAFELTLAAHVRLGVRHPSAVVFELLHGAAAGLDPYTAYRPPAGVDPAAAFADYGLTVAASPHGLAVTAVAADSWAAAHSGLRPGSRVVRVNGVPVAGNPAALIAAVRTPGPDGHRLDLAEADDADESPDQVEAVRLPVPAPTVYAVGLARPGVGTLRLAAFTTATPGELDDALTDLARRGARAVAVDLRGNPGGSLAAAVAAAGRFRPAGRVAIARGVTAIDLHCAGGPAWAGPLVLAVDGDTASAAELFAAACQAGGRAAVVGEQTFGKGAVQSAPVPLAAGSLVVTVAVLDTPAGVPLDGRGVMPDTAGDFDRAVSRAAELAGR